MAEGQQLVTMDKWYGGMTSDEYLGGHFYYGENIDIRSNSKAFKLSKRIIENILNYRSTGYHNKLITCKREVLGFTQDGRIEGTVVHKDTAFPGSIRGGCLYDRDGGAYLNAISFGDYLVGVTSSELDAFEIDTDQEYGLGIWGDNEVVTSDLSEDNGWTVGTGWTTGASGAVHTPGNVGTLEQTITPGVGTGRIAVYAKNWTAGYFTIKYGATVIDTIEITTGIPSEKRYTYNITTSASDVIKITPSTDFNGTLDYVKVYKYDATKIDAGITLASSAKKPLLHDGGILYIGCGDKIQTVDTTLTFDSWVVEDGLTLNKGDLIVGITKIGNIIYIYATNGNDGIKYMWNGVDENPNEKTIWKNKPFISVDGDGNQDYVICGSTSKRDFYTTVGYEKQIISQSNYLSNYDASGEYNAYRLSNRFDVKDIIGFYGDTVWLGCYGGLYTYGTYLPGLSPSMVKEYASNDTIYIERVLSMSMLYSMPNISYQSGRKNIIARIEQTQHNKQGYLLTSPIIGENLSEEKELAKMRIGYYLPSSLTSIKIYAMANDKYFHRFYVSGVSTEPSIGDTYTNYSNNVFTVIDTDLTDIEVGFTETLSIDPGRFNLDLGATGCGVYFKVYEDCTLKTIHTVNASSSDEINIFNADTGLYYGSGTFVSSGLGGAYWDFDLTLEVGTNYFIDGTYNHAKAQTSTFPYIGEHIEIYAGREGGTQTTDVRDIYSIGLEKEQVGGYGTITFTSQIPTDGQVNGNEGILTKISGVGQTSIDYTDYDNYCLIKTITTDKYKYGNEYIFSQPFIDAHLPVLHKLQFKIELLTTENNLSPEIYDIPILTNIIKDGL